MPGGHQYALKHPTKTARDSITSVKSVTHHTITSQESDQTQVAVLDYNINIVTADASGRFHYTDSAGGTKLWTIPLDNQDNIDGDLTPDAVATSSGNNLGIQITGNSGATVVVSTVVAERH